ncbi:MAG: motility protein A [Acidothermus cellulolyticus]|nr:motility protein A [Acidothermus cellulolyticus]
MDVGTIVGILLGFSGIFMSMILEGSKPTAILLPAPMMLVILGTLGAAMAGGLLKDTIGSIKWLKTALLAKPIRPDGLVDELVKLADRARREGLLALEDAANEVDDDFLRKGLQLAIDGTDPEELREILDAEIVAKRTEFKQGAKLFLDMGGYSPTLGIIGTVVSLVHVLANLSSPESLGKLIASAFVATLWGVMLANIVWLPLSNKIGRLGELAVQQMELVIEGVLSIQAGVNPRLIRQKLQSLLPADPKAEKAKQEKAA